MKEIELEDDDIEEVRKLARERAEPKQGFKSERVWGSSALEDDILGLMGEKAVAKFLDESIFKWASLSGDNGVDIVLEDCIDIEVRTGKKEGYRFALGSTDFSEFESDIGVLAWKLSDDKVGLPGWTTKVHFMYNAKMMNFGYGNRLAIEPKDLLSMDKLYDLKKIVSK